MNAILTTTFRSLMEYLAKRATPQHVLAYDSSPEQQMQLGDMLDRNADATLSAVERLELAQIVFCNDALTQPKERAQASLYRRY
ncbi:MAG: hypothetical protein IPM16_14250 [Chloroflexi bacterium]|nr:hypothetical protein [Chloroflexota bacterium]